MPLVNAERALENRAHVRMLLGLRQPAFAAALASAEQDFSCSVCSGRRPERDNDRAPVSSSWPSATGRPAAHTPRSAHRYATGAGHGGAHRCPGAPPGPAAAATRLLARDTDRSAFLATVAARWAQLDPTEYPFVRQVAAQLPGHDDREQFLAGIDLILAGITTVI